MTREQAVAVLLAEAARLRSGGGGHGGKSAPALRIAEAIEVVLQEPESEWRDTWECKP